MSEGEGGKHEAASSHRSGVGGGSDASRPQTPTRSGAFDVQRLNGTQAAVFLGPASAIVLKAQVALDAELLVRHVRRASPHICILLVSASARLALHLRLRHLSLAGLDDLFELDFAGEDVRLLEAIRRHGFVRLPHWVPPLSGANDARTHAVVAFCLRSGDRRLSAEQVADWFGEHRRSLNRWVQPVTGRTVSQWLNEGRVRCARAMLEPGHMESEVADVMGYAGAAGVSMLLRRANKRESSQ